MNVVKKIDNSDFEFYSIKLPLIITKNKRNAYISKELEKKHPCFSDRCWWKPKLKIKDKSFVASIAVIDKVKLARYKEENPGKILEFRENNKKIFFIEKELGLIFLVSLLFIMFIIIMIVLGTKNNKKNAEQLETLQYEINAAEISNIENDIEICSRILERISLYDGKVTSFSIDANMLNMNVYGCFPEDIRIKNIQSSDLVFRNNIPYFSIQKRINTPEIHNSYSSDETEDNDFHVKIRNILLTYKVNLLNENIEQNSFVFETAEFFSVFKDINRILSCADIWIKNVSISRENEKFSVKIMFSNNANNLNEILNVLLQNKSVFKTDVTYEKKMIKEVEQVKESDNWEKIGTITKNNTKIEFYKDLEGKIRRIEK